MRQTLLAIATVLTLWCPGLKAQSWTDVTSIFITNPGFDNGSQGWTLDGWGGSFGALNYGCMEVWNGVFALQQQLTGLPQGHWRLSVQAYYRLGENASSYLSHIQGDEQIAAVLAAYTGDDGQWSSPLCSVFDYSVEQPWASQNDWYRPQGQQACYPNSMYAASQMFAQGMYTTTLEFDGGGDVVIGIENWEYENSNWCIWDNFKLEYQGQAVTAQSVSVTAPKTGMVVGEQMQLTATVLPANTLDKRVRWTSSSTGTATVSQDGMVTALKAGTVTITAQVQDGTGKRGSVTLTIENTEVEAGAIVINEVMASNVDEFISPAWNFDGFIELYNPTDKGLPLGSLVVSNDKGERWQMPLAMGALPAKGHRAVWFDSADGSPTNVPFKLDTDGGTITISKADGTVVATQTYPASLQRVSYARTTDGGPTWGLSAEGTPGLSNDGSTFAAEQLAAPVVDQPSQLFSGELSVNVVVPAGCTLRYTTDGSLPTLTNGQSSAGQLRVSETTVARFRLFASGKLPSEVTTRSYIYKDRDYYLPVVAVVTPWEFLYDEQIGVMTTGPNGRPGNGQSALCNWNMNWDRPVNFSYLDAGGQMVLNQDVNLEMCGGWSRAWTPHSFKLKGNKELGGEKDLLYPFFSQKPYIRNRTLQIRNGGNDTGCRFKDPAIATIVQTSGIDVDVQSYQPIHEFINGQYMGVLNVREPNNKHYVYANYGWDEEEIDLWEMSPDSGYVQKCGTSDAYLELVDVLSPEAANPETYQEICRLVDIDEFVNYMAIEFYLGGSDWPRNNVKSFRLRDGGKFRFVLFDTDAAFDYGTDVFQQFAWKETWTFDELYPIGTGRITEQIRLVTFFLNMLQNSDFRRRFIDAYCLVAGSVFEAARAQQICDELFEAVEPAMNLDGSSARSTYNTIRNRLGSRLSSATTALRGFQAFDLAGVEPQRVVLASDAPGALLQVNGQPVPTGHFDGNLFAPVQLKAVAPAGYAFQGWLSGSGASGNQLVAMGAQWYYYDRGSLDGQNWTSPTFSTANWQRGNAPLGFSNNATIATRLDYGSDANNKRPTYYFRTTVQLDAVPEAADRFSLNYHVDDGFVVYVNGSEAARFNMPDGTANYNTLASTYADQFPTGTLTLPASLFHKGSNTIAVEVHNNALNSSDIIWDASITAQLSGTQQAGYYATTPEISLPEGSGQQLTASFRQLTAAERRQQGLSPVRINEVSGSNGSLINEYGKKDDWVELYNTTSADIDVEGMYLSDDEQNPTLYQISKGQTAASTIVPAHGYLVVWCSKRETTSQGLHASFKVSGQGGTLLLTAADRSWQDRLDYPAHDADHTVARYPDGTASVYATNVATIARANQVSSYAEEVEQTASGIGQTMIASANGFRLRAGHDVLLLKSDDAEDEATVEVYTTDGRLVERHTVSVAGGTARLSVAHLPKGLYVARATITDGNSVGCKFVR